MRIENFLALTLTTVVNEPCVNNFENIVFEANKVKRGDLFFAYDKDDIKTAVDNGAYGIVFEKSTQITDSEIAWIKAESIDNALKRLLRFKIIEKEVVAYECNEIILKLALQISTSQNFLVLHGDMRSLYKTMLHVEKNTIVLFCPALTDKDMFTSVKALPNIAIKPIEIVEQTLFETSFIYNNHYFERQLVSPFFIPYLEELFHLYETVKIEYCLKKISPIEHFEPVFTNKNLEIKNFGTSDNVLIFEKNKELIDSEISFLQERASWANIIILLPSSMKHLNAPNIFYYGRKDAVIDILKANTFNFAFIVGVDKSILDRPITSQVQPTLF